MADIRDFYTYKQLLRSRRKQRQKRPDPQEWLKVPELQDSITDAAFQIQEQLMMLCLHSATVRMGKEQAEKALEQLVRQLWQEISVMDIPLSTVLVAVESVRADFLHFLMEKSLHGAVSWPPIAVKSALRPHEQEATARKVREESAGEPDQ